MEVSNCDSQETCNEDTEYGSELYKLYYACVENPHKGETASSRKPQHICGIARRDSVRQRCAQGDIINLEKRMLSLFLQLCDVLRVGRSAKH